jgi:glyoxylase-like metal-dependent hydrolase (beta-lactamase superfamily II)
VTRSDWDGVLDLTVSVTSVSEISDPAFGRFGLAVSAAGDHLVQLTRMHVSNCYLVREHDGLTLIDTSLRGSAELILRVAEALGSPIRRILVTHPHVDHVGSLDVLRSLLPDVEIMMSERDARLMRGDFSRGPDEPTGRLLRASFARTNTAPTHTLLEGQRVGSLEVLNAPGHTPGQLALMDTRDLSLICGDAFYALGALFVSSQPVLRFPFAAFGTWHRPTANETAKKLRQFEPSRLAAGHGRVLEHPLEAMDRALRAVDAGGKATP